MHQPSEKSELERQPACLPGATLAVKSKGRAKAESTRSGNPQVNLGLLGQILDEMWGYYLVSATNELSALTSRINALTTYLNQRELAPDWTVDRDESIDVEFNPSDCNHLAPVCKPRNTAGLKQKANYGKEAVYTTAKYVSV